MGSEERREIYEAHAREVMGSLCFFFWGGCISHAEIGIFTKTSLGLNEEEQEISLIMEKEKNHKNNISICFNRNAGNVFWDLSKILVQ